MGARPRVSRVRAEPTFTQTYARTRLARLERCKTLGIKPMRGGDELVCANDQTRLCGSPLAHDPAEVRSLQEMAGLRR